MGDVMYRVYTDVLGANRKIKYVRLGQFVKWHMYHLPSITEIWQLEDGSNVQIPMNSWEILGIKYSDIMSMEN